MTPSAFGVGGEPASGKSTLVRAALSCLGPGLALREGTLRGTTHLSGRVAVLGLYGATGDPFPGTDRLSMAVQPAAVAYLRRVARGEVPARAVLFEGDRLFNASFLLACRGLLPASRFLVLTASDAARAARRAGRGDTKPEAFLRGRATKYRNILARVPGVAEARCENEDDLGALAAEVVSWVHRVCGD